MSTRRLFAPLALMLLGACGGTTRDSELPEHISAEDPLCAGCAIEGGACIHDLRSGSADGTEEYAARVSCDAACCAQSTVADEPASAAPIFRMRSRFWVGLHHALHYAATARRPPPEGVPSPSDPAWEAAVAHYRDRFGEGGGFGVLFDDALIALRRRLSETADDEVPAGLDAELTGHLVRAAEVVRPRWSEDDARNRRWIAALEPRLAEHGAALRDALVEAYGVPWSEQPIEVDVSCLAGPVGAYTIEDPVLVTISSCDEAYAGPAALEMIFHEASHPLVGVVERRIAARASELGREPGQLWHAVIFYTAGELARRRLGPSYVPYAIANELWGGRMGARAPLEAAWRPFLDGERSLEEAVDALLRAAE